MMHGIDALLLGLVTPLGFLLFAVAVKRFVLGGVPP